VLSVCATRHPPLCPTLCSYASTPHSCRLCTHTLQDELLLYAYLELEQCAGLDGDEQQREDQQLAQQPSSSGSGASTSTSSSSWTRPAKGSSLADECGAIAEEEGGSDASRHQDDSFDIAAAAAASRRYSGSGLAGLRSATGSATAAAAAAAAKVASKRKAAAAARSASFVGSVSPVTTERLALLNAQGRGGSGGSSHLLGGVGSASFGGIGSRAGSARSGLSKMRLKRSSHVQSAADLQVSVWWVKPPELSQSGG
jgi:hypothetical protein